MITGLAKWLPGAPSSRARGINGSVIALGGCIQAPPPCVWGIKEAAFNAATAFSAPPPVRVG